MTRSYVAQHCGGATGGGQCPIINASYPTCPYGQQPTAQYDYRGCITGYQCSGSGYQGRAPVITSFTGPTALNVGQTGTWTVVANDPDGSSLSYSINWGDVQSGLAAAQSTYLGQTTTFTHSYNTYGTYTVRITVTDAQNLTATTTATVTVGSGTIGGGSNVLQLISPNGGTYYAGSTMSITWADYISNGTQPYYTLTLVNNNYTGCTIYGCSSPSYSYPIATGVYGSSYSWSMPSSIPTGTYLVQICRYGGSDCDVSDSAVYINQNVSQYTTFTVSPSTGSAPLTVTASATMTTPSGSITPCGTLTLGTLDWGDGTTDTMTYLGCSSGTQTVTRTHTYTTSNTYTVRLYGSGTTLGTQTVYVGTNGGSSITSLTVTPTSISRGSGLTINWTLPSTWSDARIRLEIRDVNGNPVGESGIVNGLAAQTGSYVWTIPSSTEACVADAGRVCGQNIVDGRQYVVRAIVYTPANACFGYCAPGYAPTTVATRDSNAFVVNGSTSTLNPQLTINNDGVQGTPYYINVTARTTSYGTSCTAGNTTLDYGDGQTQTITANPSGSYDCSYQYDSFTHYYTAPGTYTVVLRNAAYPYATLLTQAVTVY
jgi:hypothetical protein